MKQNPDINIIGVADLAASDDRDRDKFISNMRVQIPHVLDEPSEIWDAYEVHSMPSMVFVSADGTWERHTGRLESVDLLELANALFADL